MSAAEDICVIDIHVNFISNSSQNYTIYIETLAFVESKITYLINTFAISLQLLSGTKKRKQETDMKKGKRAKVEVIEDLDSEDESDDEDFVVEEAEEEDDSDMVSSLRSSITSI